MNLLSDVLYNSNELFPDPKVGELTLNFSKKENLLRKKSSGISCIYEYFNR